MKQRSPAFQFFPRQFAGDDEVMSMDLDTVGAHILLICAAAASPECFRIASDEHAIRTRLRNPSDDNWQRIKLQLLRGAWKIDADGKWWMQDGLRRSFEKQRIFSETQQYRANQRYRNVAGTQPEVLPKGSREDAGDAPKSCSSSSSSTSIYMSENLGLYSEAWNELRGSLAAVTRLSAGRKAKLKKRIAEGLTLETFRSVVKTCATTPYLCGGGSEGWRVDFEWLIANDTNVLKVLEGKYRASKPAITAQEYLVDNPYDEPEYQSNATAVQQ
ncbi:hypothetical protein [Acidisarcina polymorpha]|uniref:hypothetical protein n=1 Tax=Acidisarcina polymorpha TaxID=2211140 RepID=UPI000DEFC0EF|nr:hypothetical protein [Acidisarcina polymorpha]